MIGLLKNRSIRKLRKKYEALMLRARDAQRSGDIQGHSELHRQADDVLQQIENLAA